MAMTDIESSITIANCKIENPQEIMDKLWELGIRPTGWTEKESQ